MTEEPVYPILKWRWRVADPLRPGRRYLSRHHMTEQEALDMDPSAERDLASQMVIERPVSPHSGGGYGKV